MSFEESIVGFEERLAEMMDLLCVVIGGVFILFALMSIMDYSGRSMTYAIMAIAFLMFPITAEKIFKREKFVQSPPALITKKK